MFLRKSLFCSLAGLNHGFGGPWDSLWIFLSNSTFIMLLVQKFLNFMPGFKSDILAIFQFCHNATFESFWEIYRATAFRPDCNPSIIGPSLKSKRLVVGVRLVIIIKMIWREKKSASSLHLFFWEKLLLHTEVLYMSKKHTSLKKNTNWAKISHFWGKSFYFDM